LIRVYKNRLFTSLPGLHRVRKERGLSVRELGELSGVSYVNIVRIENEQQKATLSSLHAKESC
jgi:transcriptional regulator with XRE-family HTH domain